MLKDKEPAPGIFGRIYQVVHPDNWSDRTKTWIWTTLSVVQLGSHLLNTYQQLPRVPESSLSSQDRNAIEKELNLLRNLVSTNKYKVLGNQATFERLTKKNPEIREALQELVKYSTAPSKELQNQFFDQYAAYRQDVLLGKEAAPPSQWVSELKYLKTSAYQATVLHKSDQLKLERTAAAAARALEDTEMSMTASQSSIEQLNAASQAMQASQSFFRQCSVAEYIQPKKAVTPQALLELKQEVIHMQRKLRETMLSQPQSAAGPNGALGMSLLLSNALPHGIWKSMLTKPCQEVSFAWDISTQQSMREALQEYQAVTRMSMQGGGFRHEEGEAFIENLAVKGDLRKAVFLQPNTRSTIFKELAEEILIEEELLTRTLANFFDQDFEFIKLILQNGRRLGEPILRIFYAKVFGSNGNASLQGSYEKYRNVVQLMLDNVDLSIFFDLTNVALARRNPNTRNLALQFIKAGKNPEEALQAAQAGIGDSNRDVRSNALELFKALFVQGMGFDEAVFAAQTAFSDSSWHVRSIGLELFEALFAQGKGFNEAVLTAQTAFSDSDWYVRSTGLELFEALFAQGKGFDEAVRAAETAISDPDDDVKSSALQLFEALLIQGKGIDEADRAARTAINDSDEDVRSHALKIIEALLKLMD